MCNIFNIKRQVCKACLGVDIQDYLMTRVRNIFFYIGPNKFHYWAYTL